MTTFFLLVYWLICLKLVNVFLRLYTRKKIFFYFVITVKVDS